MQKPEILTTDEFNRQLFRPHGKVAFMREGQILVCEAIGPFNKELVEAVAGVTVKLIAEMTQHGKWGGDYRDSKKRIGKQRSYRRLHRAFAAIGRSWRCLLGNCDGDRRRCRGLLAYAATFHPILCRCRLGSGGIRESRRR